MSALVWTTIAVAAVVAVLMFYSGVRYAHNTLLPIWLARMDEEELGDLAAKAARERPDDEG